MLVADDSRMNSGMTIFGVSLGCLQQALISEGPILRKFA
jgi:hypothetical protein